MSLSIYGCITRDLATKWQERADSNNKLRVKVLPMAFHDMKIFPSRSQVHEMLHCASECSHRPSADYITFGEFCIFASELKSCYDRHIPQPIPLSKMPDKSTKRGNLGKSKSTTKYEGNSPPFIQVFLGGSCNPTTWRQDTAIPMLKSLGITYYNPQVTHWGPELLELERQAKKAADVLFFVIDNQTRSVASIMEAAHISGCHRKLILVIKAYEGPGQLILGEPLSEREYLDLSRGQSILQDIVERQGIPVFENITVALNCTAKILQEGLSVEDLGLEDMVQPVQFAHIQLGDKLVKLRETFDALDTNNSGELTLRDVCMAFKVLTNQELSLMDLKSIISSNRKSTFRNVMEISWDDIHVNFDQFCSIFVEFKETKYQNRNFPEIIVSYLSTFFRAIATPLCRVLDWFLPKGTLENFVLTTPGEMSNSSPSFRDIHLGGTCGTSTWREDIAIPLLKKNGLTYYNPQLSRWSERLIPIECAALDNCGVLLFVITNTARSVASMALAAHFIGLGCNVVLCIQYLPDDCTIAGERLSIQALKDYNRGRIYLSDLANQEGIPVFEDIVEAVECAIQKCKTKQINN